MFYVLNNREAKVTDAIFLVIPENVTQIYLILYFLQSWLQKSSLEFATY